MKPVFTDKFLDGPNTILQKSIIRCFRSLIQISNAGFIVYTGCTGRNQPDWTSYIAFRFAEYFV